MGGFLVDLENKSIITSGAVSRLKSYISRKNSSLSLSRRAIILADALNKAIEARLPKFEEKLQKSLKKHLIEHIVKKPIFEIYCSDVFQAAVKIKENNESFFDELDVWLSENLDESITREQIVRLVLETHRLVELHPEMDITEAIIAAEPIVYMTEAIIAAEPDKKITEAIKAAEPAINVTDAIMDDEPIYVHEWIEVTTKLVRVKAREPYILPAQLIKFIRKLLVNVRGKGLLAAGAVVIFLIGMPFLLGLDSMASKAVPATNHTNEASIPSNSVIGQTASDNEADAASKESDIERRMEMKATAYDLSVASCGKRPNDPGYGITSTGTKAKVGRTVAVDPNVVPLGSRLFISFPEEYKYLDGVYIAEDTGRLIKGNTIDIFFGEDKTGSTDIYDKAMKFGVRYVNIEILSDS